MGQRHQLYVIANVRGTYRTLAVVHNQWLYGYSALRAVLKVLKVFSAKANGSHIRRELRKAALLNWEKDVEAGWKVSIASRAGNGENVNIAQGSDTVFPFISTCLILATSLKDEIGDVGPTSLLPLLMNVHEFHNDDGISIFDITDPSHPRYGLVFLKDVDVYRSSPASEDEDVNADSDIIPRMTVLDAKAYIRRYYGEEALEKDTVLECSTLALIDPAALENRWPDEHWPRLNVGQDEPVVQDEPTRTPNLKDLSLAQLVEGALRGDPNDTSWLSAAGDLHDFLRMLRSRLYNDPSLLRLPSGLSLLIYVLKDCDSIDLSPFSELSSDQICSIVKKTQDGGKCTTSLSLPDDTDMTASQLRDIVTLAEPKELHIGDTSIQLDDLLDLIVSTNITNFSSPALYTQALDLVSHKSKPRVIKPGQLLKLPLNTNFPCGAGTQFPVCQIVFFQQILLRDCERLEDGGIRWSRHVPDPGQGYSNEYSLVSCLVYEMPKVVIIPIQDALMSHDSLISRLPQALHRLVRSTMITSFMTLSEVGMGAAQQLAIDDTQRAFPVPADCYATFYDAFHCNVDLPPRMQEIVPGQWTIFVYHERPSRHQFDATITGPPILRYAFVTVDEDKKLRVLNARDFLQATLPSSGGFDRNQQIEDLSNEWDRKMRSLEDAMTGDTQKVNDGKRARVTTSTAAEIGESMTIIEAYNTEILDRAAWPMYQAR